MEAARALKQGAEHDADGDDAHDVTTMTVIKLLIVSDEHCRLHSQLPLSAQRPTRGASWSCAAGAAELERGFLFRGFALGLPVAFFPPMRTW